MSRNRRQIRRMIFNRTYGRRASNNNNDTLDLIARLPLQITNDPFASQILNGSSFY
ncbi:20143_t:CDS:2 [Rhizophagus irregularis]|nr:20143_t:CDS:2 [Rhizophagus irregularis]